MLFPKSWFSGILKTERGLATMLLVFAKPPHVLVLMMGI